MLEVAAKILQRFIDGHQLGGLLIAALGILFRFANNHADALEHTDIIGIAPACRQPAAHVFTKLARLLQRFLARINGIGGFGGKGFARFRRARLEHNRTALRRATDVERSLHREVVSFMI